MANVKTKLDTRRAKADGTYNIIYRITHYKKVYTINSGVSILEHYWDYERSEILKQHPNAKLINLKLLEGFFKIERAILTLDDDFTIKNLRSIIKGNASNSSKSFKEFAQHLIEQMMQEGRTGNAIVYQTAVNRLIAFSSDDIALNKIDYKLLTEFIHHLKLEGLKTNSISNYLRSIRAIYNKAIKHKIVDKASYPFYDIRIKSQKTSKRAISKAVINQLVNLPLEENSPAKKTLNYFLLSFYLRGISFTDMAYLKRSNIINGRVHYVRRKTHKLYSVRLFTPGNEIINNLHCKERDYLLPVLANNIVEDSLEAKKIINQWIKTTNKYLNRMSLELQSEINITTYTSRHSFATIAKHLGYSNELIAEAFGHAYGNKTTAIYLDAFDESTLDAMHEKVILLDTTPKSV
jgi:site-specific recombinase XerD